MTQNNVSLAVLLILLIICGLLVLAHFFLGVRKHLVTLRFLEANEEPISLLYWIISIVIIVKLFQAFIIQPFIVDGASMLDTYHDKEFLLVDKISYRLHSASRGDVVIFRMYNSNQSPYSGRYLIKRVIGLPGETVSVKNGVTTIYNKENTNGFTLPEPFVTRPDLQKNVYVTLKEDEYFVMGDNRAESYDSRSWGPLKADHLRGEVLVRVLPFKQFGVHPGEEHYSN